jgi:hypothetical protein
MQASERRKRPTGVAESLFANTLVANIVALSSPCLLCSDENGRVKSRPDPPHVLHLTRPFSHSRKNPETGRIPGRGYSGAGRKRGSIHPARILGIPYTAGNIPYLTRMNLSRTKAKTIHIRPNRQPASPTAHM